MPTARNPLFLSVLLIFFSIVGCDVTADEPLPDDAYDVLIINGTIYDGTGSEPIVGDLAIRGDTIASIGSLSDASARTVIDAEGMAVAPGFINMLSWAAVRLIHDGRGMSDIMQGVTLEVFGEGESMGPFNDEMKRDREARQTDIQYDVSWTTLGEFLDYLVDSGVSPNVGSFVGATTVRVHELGYEDREPTAEELERMQDLVREAMQEGAFGVGSSLIYAPASYAKTDELTALAEAASEFGGMYITHMRSEGDRVLEALDEAIQIGRDADVPVEIYHLKLAGQDNWGKFDEMVARIEEARESGHRVTTNMYLYTAGSTGLDAAMPPWVQEGGLQEWRRRLQDPELRARTLEEMRTRSDEWESLYLLAGSPDRVVLTSFRQDSLRYLIGKSLAEVAEERGTSPEEVAMDLVVHDNSRVGVVYYMMSEENVQRKIALPYMSFGSDGGAFAPEGIFLNSQPHPRAYGNFARLLGRYVRDEQVISLEEAIRRLTTLPAENLGISRRAQLTPGYFADVVVFDPEAVHDPATFEEPHQLAEGMRHVFVNGTHVVNEGEHTGATPGRKVVRER